MANPVNANIAIRFVTVEGNSGANWDYTISSSTVNIQNDWLAHATPIHAGISARPAVKNVHYRYIIASRAYATPAQLYPYHLPSKYERSGSISPTTFTRGRQFFTDALWTVLKTGLDAATPVV